MSTWEDDLLDELLTEAPELQALAEALPWDGPSPEGGRDRLLAAAHVDGRFERFVETVAAMLDVETDTARELLDRIGAPDGAPDGWYESMLPDVSLIDLEGGPAVANAITGFLRMPAGAEFPEHGHLGEEKVLVIQGSFEDLSSGRIVRPGDVAKMSEGSAHAFRVRPGPDLVYMVVAEGGIRIGDQVLGPDDPRV